MTFCHYSGLTNWTGPIAAGHWALEGAREASPPETDNDNFGVCPKGHYCPEGTSSPIACPPGTYG